MDLLLIEIIEEGAAAKTAVGAQQADPFSAQPMQRVGQECLRVIGRAAVAGAQPAVGDHPRIGCECEQGMMAGAASFGWVVAAHRACLARRSGSSRGRIQIERDAVDRQLPEHPRSQGIHHGLIGALGEFFEESHYGFKVGHALEAEQAFQYRVVPGNFAVLEAVGTAPHREHELGDEQLPGGSPGCCRAGGVRRRIGQPQTRCDRASVSSTPCRPKR